MNAADRDKHFGREAFELERYGDYVRRGICMNCPGVMTAAERATGSGLCGECQAEASPAVRSAVAEVLRKYAAPRAAEPSPHEMLVAALAGVLDAHEGAQRSTSQRRGNYPIRPVPTDDARFTIGLTEDVARVLEKHGYPPVVDAGDAREFVNLQQALFAFLYKDRE